MKFDMYKIKQDWKAFEDAFLLWGEYKYCMFVIMYYSLMVLFIFQVIV